MKTTSPDPVNSNKMYIYRFASVQQNNLNSQRILCKEKLETILNVIIYFGAPITLSLIWFLVLVLVYNVYPLTNTNLVQTSCKFNSSHIFNKTAATCNFGTDSIYPCVKIFVTIIGPDHIRSAVLMENEHTLTMCNECSYTYGRYGLFRSTEDDCSPSDDSVDLFKCAQNFISRYDNDTERDLPCYFDEAYPNQAVAALSLDRTSVVHMTVWPLLLVMLYTALTAFGCYFKRRNRVLEQARTKGHRPRAKQLVTGGVDNPLYMPHRRHRRTDSDHLCHTLGLSPPRRRCSNHHGGQTMLANGGASMSPAISLPSVVAADDNRQQATADDRATAADDELTTEQQDLRHLDLAVTRHNVEALLSAVDHVTATRPRVLGNDVGGLYALLNGGGSTPRRCKPRYKRSKSVFVPPHSGVTFVGC